LAAVDGGSRKGVATVRLSDGRIRLAASALVIESSDPVSP